MKIKVPKNNVSRYIYLTFSLIFTFWLISLFEIYSKTSNGIVIQSIGTTLTYKLLNDFGTGIIIGLLFFPLYLTLAYIKKPLHELTIKVLFSLIVIAQFALVKYSITTLINLGADILGYSMGDMYTTVTASESISFAYFLPFFFFPILYLGIDTFFIRYIDNRQIYVVSGILIILLGSLKLFIPAISDVQYQNKINFFISDILRFQNDKNITKTENLFYKNEFPLVKPFKLSEDVLSPFFEIHDEKPNIVMIVVEGLGDEFIGKNYYKGFTPYLDSLIPKSLYWSNFLSNTGRTFGVVPSLLGSLPYGESGFLDLNPLPTHVSLISILKENKYTTSYYSGDESSFDKKINFLEYDKIDNVTDVNKFGPKYVKTKENSGGFSWGYPDAEIFKKTLSELGNRTQPRLDIIMSLTNHEPFEFPEKQLYLKKVDSISDKSSFADSKKEEIKTYKDIFASLLYTDNSIKNFMQAYAKRPEFKNTIFIITGDHRLIPLNQKDKLCRFHVPLFIYSPMLKKMETFKSISSHWDVTPSLVSFLINNYKFNKMENTAWMSQGLDTVKQFRNIHEIPLMRNKGNINDYVYKDYLYSDGKLFKINEDFETSEVDDDKILKTMSEFLTESKRLNAYLTKKNKIIPNSFKKIEKPTFVFSKEELVTIKKLTKGLDNDKIFMIARNLAFNKEHVKSRLLCDYILNDKPNNADVRTLKGRVYGWDKNYKKAEIELLEVIKRTPFYSDSYMALMDIYFWSGQNKKSIAIAKKADENELKNPNISLKLAATYKRMKDYRRSKTIIDSIIKIYPQNNDYLTFKKSLRK